jgi:hypothetical protein
MTIIAQVSCFIGTFDILTDGLPTLAVGLPRVTMFHGLRAVSMPTAELAA